MSFASLDMISYFFNLLYVHDINNFHHVIIHFAVIMWK